MMCGKSVVAIDDPLSKVDVERVVESIRNPKLEIRALISQLRLVYSVDYKRYSEQKRRLPYFTCSVFDPPYRRKQNFAHTSYFILDLDKLQAKGYSIVDLKRRVSEDRRVMVCFVSPSEDGLKVLFKLKDKCFDAGLYSIFYKAFAKSFSTQYNLDQVLDDVTCDVSRACFISNDSDIYYNADAEPVDIEQYLKNDNPQTLYDQRASQLKEEREALQAGQDSDTETPLPSSASDPSDEVMEQIKAHLFKRTAKPQAEREAAIIPRKLQEITEPLCQFLNGFGIEIVSVRDISYAKQLHLRSGFKEAQINVFCSNRGVINIVPTTLRGTDRTFTDTMYELIESFFEDMV